MDTSHLDAATQERLAALLNRIPSQWLPQLRCQAGWGPLLAQLEDDLAALCPGYWVYEVKEKFGTLRFSWDVPESVDDAVCEALAHRVGQAERESAQTCDVCGGPGRLHASHSWLRTLCVPCAVDRDYRPVNSQAHS